MVVLKGRIRKAANAFSRLAEEGADRFRHRRTEAPEFTGWPKKSQILIGEVKKKIVEGVPGFVADFVPARKGSLLNPYYRAHGIIPAHTIITAFETASQQAILAALKKIEGLRGIELPVATHKFRTNMIALPTEKLFIEIFENSRDDKFINFKCRIVGANAPNKLFAEGRVTISKGRRAG